LNDEDCFKTDGEEGDKSLLLIILLLAFIIDDDDNNNDDLLLVNNLDVTKELLFELLLLVLLTKKLLLKSKLNTGPLQKTVCKMFFEIISIILTVEFSLPVIKSLLLFEIAMSFIIQLLWDCIS
jgi:hypothetical protein